MPFDAIVIVLILIVNAVLGYIQESKAEAAVEALSSMTAPQTNVLRDGKIERINTVDVVPGDIIVLGEGDSVSADGRLFAAASLRIAEASLTGESVPVGKKTDTLAQAKALGDRANMVFNGTSVTQGTGRAIVTSTGMGTQVGKIADLLQATEDDETPLQKEMNYVSKILGSAVCIIAVVVLVALALTEGFQDVHDVIDSLLLAVSLAVAAVPEGLAAILTVVLALGVQTVSAPALIFAAALASLAYLSIIYAFSVTLQHIGKGICVVLVFAQIPGATGLYPIEMTSPFFQSIYPLFPFTYGIGAMREAICGFYGSHYGDAIGMLVFFFALFMAFGILLRPLMANVNRMVAGQVRDGGLFNGEDVDIPVRPYRISQIMRALSDKDTYATALQQRYATFNRWYPQLIRGSVALGLAVPVALAVVFALTPAEKVWLLTGWLIWIIVIFVALVVIESLRFSFERQLKLESLSDASLIDLYGATADVERAACMDARDAGFGDRERACARDAARDGAEGEEARHE